jgi:predicted nucleic acid-binding protein
LTSYFVDTSALAKRYLAEPGHQWVRSWIHPDTSNPILISELATVEMLALLTRRVNTGELKPDTALTLRRAFLVHVREEYKVVSSNKRTFIDAREIVTKYGLRTLDALQLASGRRARAALGVTVNLIFVTADDKLLDAASSDRFQTDTPSNHPDQP